MNPIDAIKEISGDYSIKGDGVASELDYLSFNTYQSISEKYKVAQIFDISTFINQLKMIKDEYETEMLRKSALLANRGMAVMIECLKNGTNEAEACTQSQFEMRKLWQARYPEYEVAGFGSSEGGIIDALNCWCLSGGRISYGCDCSSNYKPQKGELVLPIVWSKLGGYHVESERTLYVQEADDFKMKVFSAVIQAREKVLSMIKPGITFESMYLEAARIFEENGFTKLMPERIGHGIGLSAHEFPSTKEHNRIKLQKGMVFTVEPGLMSIKWGGVRHSDTVIVSDLGCEILTDTARGILCIN
jgi:Xaa-Pro dipeptidase